MSHTQTGGRLIVEMKWLLQGLSDPALPRQSSVSRAGIVSHNFFYELEIKSPSNHLCRWKQDNFDALEPSVFAVIVYRNFGLIFGNPFF